MRQHTKRNPLISISAIAALATLGLVGCSSEAAPEPAPASGTPAAVTPTMPASGTPASTTATTAPASPSAQKLKTHTVANGYFEFMAPEGWTVKKIPMTKEVQTDTGVATSLQVFNQMGESVAELSTGWPYVAEGYPGEEGYVQLDRAETKMGPKNPLLFEATDFGAIISVNSFGSKPGAASGNLHSEFHYQDEQKAGSFVRNISSPSELAGVPASAKGTDGYRAYLKTEEYKQLKAMMSSLKVTGKVPAAAEAQGQSGACTGAKYTYDLSGSGVSCVEAKSLVQKLQGQRPSAGSVEISGLGSCDVFDGVCTVAGSGEQFSYKLK